MTPPIFKIGETVTFPHGTGTLTGVIKEVYGDGLMGNSRAVIECEAFGTVTIPLLELTHVTTRNLVIEGVVDAVMYEDGGQAAIADVLEINAEDDGPFIQLHSWYDEGTSESHEWLRSIENKRVRVTVEVL